MGRCCTAVAGLLLLLARPSLGLAAGERPQTGPSVAQEALEITIRCPRLTNAQRDEVEARIRLLVGTAQHAPEKLAVVCDAKSAWVDWAGEKLPVALRQPLTDEFLDVVEARLAAEPGPDPEHEQQPAKTADASASSSTWAGENAADPPASGAPATSTDSITARDAEQQALRSEKRGGGMALGVAFEPPAASIEPVAGPYIEFSLPLTSPFILGSPLLFSGVQSGRFGSAGPYSIMLLDFGAGFAVGAPLVPGARFGVVSRFEGEWLIAYPDGTSARAVFAPTVTLGGRVAHEIGWAVLWTEVAGRARLGELELRGAESISAAPWAVQFTVGVAFLDRR